MRAFAIVAVLFIAAVAQAEQPQEHQPAVVVPSSEVAQPAPISGAAPIGVEHHVSHVEHQPHHVEHQPHHVDHQPQQPAVIHHHEPIAYYSSPPAGVVQILHQGQAPKPVQYSSSSVASSPASSVSSSASVSSSPSGEPSPVVPAPVEQYGKPESASIPANYKPFGSWGLYIGGNPADGYYTNYYKSLGNSVEKQVPGVVPTAAVVEQPSPVKPSAFNGPLLRQAFNGPYVVGSNGPDVYPYDHSYYTPADLNSGQARYVSPVQAGSQVYGTPSASYEPGSSLLSYADQSYANTKRLAGSYPTKQREVQAPVQQHQVQHQEQKGYQARAGYVYSPLVQASGASSVHHSHQPQVVAYPVPVGSQIVGSQPGIDGAFQPYGIHAFTRYAVKPTVVSSTSDQAYYQPSAFPSYKQQGQTYSYSSSLSQQVPQQVAPHYHQSFYGYPLSQLHYSSNLPSSSSSGVVSPISSPSSIPSSNVVGHHQHQAEHVVGSPESHHQHQFEGPVSFVPQPVEIVGSASEKSESTNSASHSAASSLPSSHADKHQHGAGADKSAHK